MAACRPNHVIFITFYATGKANKVIASASCFMDLLHNAINRDTRNGHAMPLAIHFASDDFAMRMRATSNRPARIVNENIMPT